MPIAVGGTGRGDWEEVWEGDWEGDWEEVWEGDWDGDWEGDWASLLLEEGLARGRLSPGRSAVSLNSHKLSSLLAL